MEKRKHTRVPLALPIRMRIVDIDEFTELYSTNLGEGGIFVRMNYPPPVGSKVELTFHLEGVKKTIQARGEVVRAVEEADKGDGPTGMAVQFTDLGKDAMRFIQLVVRKFNRHHPSRWIQLPADFFDEIGPKARSVSET